MVGLNGPFVLQRFFTLGPLKNAWNNSDTFWRTLIPMALGMILIFLFIMTIVEQNGSANCIRNYGQDYRYDTEADGKNAATKCVNKKTGERKPIVVDK